MEIIHDFIELHRNGVVEWEDVERAIEGYYLALGERRAPMLRRHQFKLENLSDKDVLRNFRIRREHLTLLQRCLQIPEVIDIAERGYRVLGMTALCILLRRLAYPNRLCDLESNFAMSSAALSSTFKYMVTHVLQRKGHLLTRLNNHPWLNRQKLQRYSEAVARMGAPVQNCWGFIDGTARHICRPSVNQENYYSGHKRYHCQKFQATVTPDGLIINLLGPFDGRRHNAGIFRETKFAEQLRHLCGGSNPYVLYGDAAYPISDVLLKPFPETTVDELAILFNQRMSAVRQAVEWGFGKVVREFAFVDFHKNLKILKQDVSGMYKVACLLTNCHSCLYGSQVSDYFGIEPPSLEEYLQHEVS